MVDAGMWKKFAPFFNARPSVCSYGFPYTRGWALFSACF